MYYTYKSTSSFMINKFHASFVVPEKLLALLKSRRKQSRKANINKHEIETSMALVEIFRFMHFVLTNKEKFAINFAQCLKMESKRNAR